MNSLGVTPKNGLQITWRKHDQALLKPTNGSVRIEDLENDDDDMMIDAPSVRDLDQPPEISHKRQDEVKGPFCIAIEEAWKMNSLGVTPKNGLQITWRKQDQALLKPTNGSVRIEDLENDDDDMMIDAPSVRDLDQPPEISHKRQVFS
nr:hypothetical protein [Tanacetum cinerariifolium]